MDAFIVDVVCVREEIDDKDEFDGNVNCCNIPLNILDDDKEEEEEDDEEDDEIGMVDIEESTDI